MNTTAEQTPTTTACAPADSLTKSLLGYGIIAGPIYVTVSPAGVDPRGLRPVGTPGASSATATGWLQITNFVVVGLMTVARRSGSGGRCRVGSGPPGPDACSPSTA